MAQKTFSESLVQELTEMKNIGMHVPDKAIQMASDPDSVGEYENMTVSGAADLIIQLASF